MSYHFLLLAFLSVVSAWSADILYFPDSRNARSCCTRPLGCRGIPAFTCCEAPPGRAIFKWAQVFTSDTLGQGFFHNTDDSGDCLGCTYSATPADCYLNVPFETMSAVGAFDQQCIINANMQPSKLEINETTGNNTEDASANPKQCQKADTVLLNWEPYVMEGGVTEELVNDIVAGVDDQTLIKKYDLKLVDEPHPDYSAQGQYRATKDPLGSVRPPTDKKKRTDPPPGPKCG